MKCKRIFAMLLALCLLLSLCACGEVVGDKVEIAFIAKATASDFWHNVFGGAGSAATEYNVALTIQGPETEEDYETQNRMIAEAVNSGADAIVFSAIDYYNSVEAVEAAVKAGVEVVVIDSTVNTDKISLIIGTDNYAAGRMAAEAAIARGQDAGFDTLQIGLVNYDVNSANGQERERGFTDAIAEYGGGEVLETVNMDSTTDDAKRGALELLDRHPEINTLVGFNEWMTLGVGYAIQERDAAERVIGVGFDSNVVSIGMLETGEMDALIVQNPFAMGYLGVQSAYELVTGKHPQSTTTVTTTMTKEIMFQESSQKTLFKFG
jgi:ribose transport system substrate-binding protein